MPGFFRRPLQLITLLCLLLGHSFAFAKDPSNDKADKLNLFDVGFAKTDAIADPEIQKTLNQRRFYLNEHQTWGLVTLGLMGAALLTGSDGNPPIEHVMLGTATAVAYGASAYFALAAPAIPSGSASGGSALHRNLAWVHLPGMILTPIFGYLAKKKKDNGEKLTGPEKYHKDVAGITAAALAISVISVSFEF